MNVRERATARPRTRRWTTLIALAATLSAGSLVAAGEPQARETAILGREFIYEEAPFRSCHASTLAETSEGFVAAWFGGTDEGNRDVGIWLAHREGKDEHWSRPVEVATGAQPDGQRLPCWNPVLFQAKGGPLLLFYKVGPSPSRWWGMLTTSTDRGRTWTQPKHLPDGFLGPIKNKPVALSDGSLLCPSSTEDHGWRVHLERTPDLGKTWTKTEPLNDAHSLGLIQPTILVHPQKKLQILCRSMQGKIAESFSADGGKTWSRPALTDLPNPDSGIDAVTLRDGRFLLVYNHTAKGRSPLNVAVSTDGESWQAGPVLESEPGEYSYPAVIQTADGLVHTTYTWKRKRIRHVMLDPARLTLRPLDAGKNTTSRP
ncbi:MAG TPA: sialidase family protein [Isosphaeraceae bacterium]|jgi:predicted neuraminidase|nr:sialidase family protein [Isosphaeraceae bacterium]